MKSTLWSALLLFPLSLSGQVAGCSLTGTVTDPQGSRIPAAAVHATEQSTGLERETVTTSDGSYLLANLPVGIYKVSFSKGGFSDFTADRVAEVVGRTRTLNIKLSLANTTGS